MNSKIEASAPPPLLQRLYGEERVILLSDLLIRLSQQSSAARQLEATLLQPTDHIAYSQGFLANTYCVVRSSAPVLTEGFTLHHASDQRGLVHRAIEVLLQSADGRKNVLCYGYRRRKPSHSGRQLTGSASTEAYHQNSIADSLQAPQWELLLSRIGDTLMMYLLLHTSMFARLPNDCCLQLTGIPIVQVARAYKKTTLRQGAISEHHAKEERPACAENGKKAVGVSHAGAQSGENNRTLLGSPGWCATQEDAVLATSPHNAADVANAAAAGSPVREGNQVAACQAVKPAAMEQALSVRGTKRARPSSWQRRKKRRLDAAAAAAAAPRDDQYLCDDAEADTDLPPTQPLDQDSEDALAGKDDDSRRDSKLENEKLKRTPTYTQWPRYMPKPMDMEMPRAPVFYSATFPPHPGLPKKHVMNVLRGREDAGRVLYCAIFDPKNSPVVRTSNAYKAVHLAPPVAAKRVPAKHRHLLPLMEALVRRATKCPYGILLQAYCPLPRQMQRAAEQLAPRNVEAQKATDDVAASNHGETKPRHGGGDSMDAIMDELFAMEQVHISRRQQAKETLHAVADVADDEAPGDNRTTSMHHERSQSHMAPLKRREKKQTGLRQLIAVAESQIEPMVTIGAGSMRNDAVITSKQPSSVVVDAAKSTRSHPGAAGVVASKNTIVAAAANSSVPAGASAHNAAPSTEVYHAHATAATSLDAARDGMQTEDHKTSPSAAAAAGLATCFVPHAQVSGFVWAVIRRTIPASLLGNKRNQRVLRSAVHRFVGLRRYEQMTVGQVMRGIKTSTLGWLYPGGQAPAMHTTDKNGETQKPQKRSGCPPSQAAAQQRMLALWLGWLFACFVVPLLRAHFYCTESEAYRHQVFYYRKPVWSRLKAAAINDLSGSQFAPLPAVHAQQILQTRKLGVARLRLLPKRVGMRCIVNMGRPSVVRFRGGRRKRSAAGAMGPRNRPAVLNFHSINSQLKSVHHVLKLEASRHSEAFGASVFGYNDVYCRLQPFIKRWRATAAAAASSRMASDGKASVIQPYIVSVDVSRAFDNVDVATLLRLVSDLLRSDQYLVIKYHEIVSCFGDIKVLNKQLAVPLDGQPSTATTTTTTTAGDISFPARAAQWAQSKKNKVFVDGVVYARLSRDEAMKIMEQHLTANLVRLKKQWHYQCRGIAQGGTLSTLLCCLYLAHVERVCLNPIITAGPDFVPRERNAGQAKADGAVDKVLSMARSSQAGERDGTFAQGGGGEKMMGIAPQESSRGRLTSLAAAVGSPSHQTFKSRSIQSGSITYSPTGQQSSQALLLRLVDDWLLVTRDRNLAANMAFYIVDGIPAFNITVNPAKTKLSFDLTLPDGRHIAAAPFVDADGARFIKWCGLLLNVNTLEIQGDYTRYAGEHISTALTIPGRRSPGAALGSKVCHFLRPKVHPLLLDSTINSARTIRVNVYQAFAVAAMKFHCHVRSAFSTPPHENSTVLMEAIEIGIRFMIKLTRHSRAAAIHRPQTGVSCDPQLHPMHVRYLGLHAFKTMLKRKQAMYAALLAQLDEALAVPACARCAAALAGAVDPQRHGILDAILY